MHEEIFLAVASGATVITASRRLARVLTQEFHAIQTTRGQRTWGHPNILPLDALLDRLWREWLWRGADRGAPLLLNEAQERHLWERVIRDSPAGESLLQIPETARAAAQTWRLLLGYRLPVDGSFEASDDAAAFAGWWREFRKLCRTNRWMERGQLSDFLREKIGAGELAPPGDVYRAGFDEITPQQADFFETLGQRRVIQNVAHAAVAKRVKLPDSREEIRSAAAWARALLESDPKAQVGVIVAPDLTPMRSAAEREFRRLLGRAVHISVGPPLRDYALIRAALLMLEFALGPMPLSRAGMLLRSPFVAGAEEERSPRALLDVKLRKCGTWEVEVRSLRDAASTCPQLQRLLGRVEKLSPDLNREQSPTEWSGNIARVLEAFGWPGERRLTSVEFQTVDAWRGVLSNLASLDVAAGQMSLSQVIDWLDQTAGETRFQPEDEGAPVQVMGMLEAAGLQFEHLWIMGLHAEALPAAARPNPFIPYAVQRQHNLPHSTPAQELEFARTVMDRLAASAPDIVLSYPEHEGDGALAPTPLLGNACWGEGGCSSPYDSWLEGMRAGASFEEIADERGPVLSQSGSTGGTALFRDMAACPFRAFAKHRLGAKPLEEPDFGLNYRDRGNTVHRALEFIWRELGSRARLMDLSPEALNDLIARGAEHAVEKLGPGIGRRVEIRRLQGLLADWLEIEKSRPEFTVAGIEAERVVTIAGVQVKLRADRVDAVAHGREMILDYKTGNLKNGVWDGDRPDEPQLPLYCITNERPVAGAAFAVLRSDRMKFIGLTMAGHALPGLSKVKGERPLPLDQQIDEWRRVLEALAENYMQGHAEVDPKREACNNCGFHAFCRTRELNNGRG